MADSQSELQEYLALIKKIELLSREEEHALALKAFDGDENARKKIVESNVFYVVKKALEKYGHLQYCIMDLIAAGNEGLVKASRDFNPERGVKFITYADSFIQHEFEKILSQHREQVNNSCDLTPNDSAGTEDAESVLNSISDSKNCSAEDELIKNEMSDEFWKAFELLPEPEKTVLWNRLEIDGRKKTEYRVLAKMLGKSKATVQGYEKKALRLVREHMENKFSDL